MPEQGYKIVQAGPSSYSVEGFFRDGNVQRLRSASRFRTEADARQWIYDQQIKECSREGAGQRVDGAGTLRMSGPSASTGASRRRDY
jgi:hypothetical protein